LIIKKNAVYEGLSNISSQDKIILWSRVKIQSNISKRGSAFRGVSRNGKKWQVQVLGSLRKRYIGSIPTQEMAARIYDYFSIVSHGLKAKTNFSYNKQNILDILENFEAIYIVEPNKSTELAAKLSLYSLP
jgi:serine kinase of HPr protein (carbohydrate metabolism regulator)